MKYLNLCLSLIAPALLVGETEVVEVQLAPHLLRNIGGVTQFDRDQFITVHESYGSKDMTDDELYYLENVLDARYGRDGGFLSWQASQTKADPNNPDMPDLQSIKRGAKKYRDTLEGRQRKLPEKMQGVVLCTHPELMHATPDNDHTPWGPRTYEGVAEFTAQFLKHYFDDDQRPQYLEVFNEPFVKIKKIKGASVQTMSEQHNVVAKRVKELNPDVKVGGYAAAWIELEQRNFGHWNDWQKAFMDIAGESMDFFSYHLYDGVNVEGAPRDRTGSNSEAIMDIIDTYSHLKFGVAKPLMITEYGKIPEGNMGMMDYSAKRSAGMLYSFNGQHMTFMDHPDRLIKTVPFILGKAMWTYDLKGEGKPGQANPFLLWRKTAEGDFVKTDLTLFYEFWKGVEGEWRLSKSSNPDVRVQFLADGNRLVVILGNLAHERQQVNLSGLERLDVSAVQVRVLSTDGERPFVAERSLEKIPETMNLQPGMGAMVFIDLEQAIRPNAQMREYRVYATDYLKAIKADQTNRFKFINTPTGNGSAVLRMSPGRQLGKAVLPTSVKLNGHSLKIPSNWAGSDQAGRSAFFGMIEFDVPMEYLATTNEVEIIYPDSGGKIACAVLQINRHEKL
ncbi:MAG: beta-agarase [Opitutaceae bacterium]